MTAIAWAIVFTGLTFYGAIWDDKLTALGFDKTLGGLTIFSLIVLMVCTLRELIR